MLIDVFKTTRSDFLELTRICQIKKMVCSEKTAIEFLHATTNTTYWEAIELVFDNMVCEGRMKIYSDLDVKHEYLNKNKQMYYESFLAEKCSDCGTNNALKEAQQNLERALRVANELVEHYQYLNDLHCETLNYINWYDKELHDRAEAQAKEKLKNRGKEND